MMPDRSCSMTAVAAALGWWVGLALILLSLFTDMHTGILGLYVSMVGGVMAVRWFLLQLEHRERNAFELGKDWGSVESLRSVHRN